MASTLSIDLACSRLPQSLTWPRCTITKLTRAASRRCHSSRALPAQETPLPRCHSSATCYQAARSYSSNDASGWGMVLVLNELLAVTASHQHRRLLRSSDLAPNGEHHGAGTARAPCINCLRDFSRVHDAASLPQCGFCSADCRASHEYMNAIDADLNGAIKPSLCCSTMNSSYSPVEPISLLDTLPSHTRP